MINMPGSNEFSVDEYVCFRTFLEKHSGIMLGDNKQYLVRSRLSPLISKYGIHSLSQLMSRVTLRRDLDLERDVINAMTTNETLWFRDNYPFELLYSEFLPALSKANNPVRIWSAASSSGQEPYSIAMTFLEYQSLSLRRFARPIEIVASDISWTMLNQCETGCYDSLSLNRGLSEQRKRQFFEPVNGSAMRLKPEVRELVQFKHLNLLDSYLLMGQFDIIFCRNVLIYFSTDNKRRIIAKLAACLPSGGTLVLGASESLNGISTEFTMQKHALGIYYTKN